MNGVNRLQKRIILKSSRGNDRLFTSIFDNADMMRNIVEILSKKNCGYTRHEIAKASGYATGGTLTDALKGLIASDFIEEYVPFGRSKREALQAY